ncbi:MAG: HEAT repeat domain-containing protein [Planctomycetes bacterium]|nr:HEAT repeat domain-containing protein [Planctomycetota bacterium]
MIVRIGLLVLLLLAAALPAHALTGWGADVNTGDGAPLMESVRADLVAIVHASEADRPALIRDFAEKKAPAAIEAVKRFRNPELKALFRELLKNPDWKIKHRALHALEYYNDTASIPAAWALLEDKEPRLVEKAAIFLLKVWDAGAAKDVAGGKAGEALGVIWSKQEDTQVRGALDALIKRVAGKLVPDKVSTEVVVKLDDGLLLTPFLDGMDKVKAAAPDYVAKPNMRTGGASASTLPPATRWAWPLLTWGKEEVNGSLQPFANLRQNNTIYHTGQDVGCCFDGAGYYAVAEGIFKMVHTGSDMGTLIVVEHNAADSGLECALTMHGGDTVFVKTGDKVACGQLLGTMGLSYSIENGGHFAHLHFGMYPGAFVATHNYGYSAVSKGLADWHDPSKWLADAIDRTSPLVRIKAPGALGDLLSKEEYGKAYAETCKGVDPVNMRVGADIKDAVPVALKKCEARRDAGFPTDALAKLKKWVGVFKNVPGQDTLDAAAKDWEKDAAFKKAVAGEKDIAALEGQLTAKKATAEEAALAWLALKKKYEGTCLEGRLKEEAAGR